VTSAPSSLAAPQHDCSKCRHSALRPYGTGELLMCEEPSTLAAFDRSRVAASNAWWNWCGGKRWEKLA
jgi:hypothetical protein